jgi:hypothetical protein
MPYTRQSTPIVTAILLVAVAGCAGKKAEPTPVPQASLPVASVAPAAGTGTPAGPGAAIPGGGPSIALPKPAKVRIDQHLITRDAILSTQYTNLYDVIQALRSNWLRIKAPDSFGQSSTLQVYLDTQRLSGVDELRQMSPTNIESVRYYDAVEASARWGMDHGAGAIYILTAKR